MINYLDKISAEKCLIFNTLIRSGNVATAAKALQLPVSKIHNELKSIEKAVGMPLLLRDKRKIVLTPVGARIADFARIVTEGLKYLDPSLTVEEVEDLNIATTHSLAETVIPSIIEEFHKQFPKVKINIFSGSEYLDFTNQDIDIVLGAPLSNRADITKTFIADFTYALYASKEYLKRKGTPKDFEDLKDHDFLIHRSLPFIEENMKDIPINMVATSTNYRALLELTRKGLGICFLCKDFLKAGLHSDRDLVNILKDFENKTLKLCFLSRKFSHKSILINALQEIMIHSIRKAFT